MRLSFSINAAAEKFQNVIGSAISDIPNVKNISDDVIIYRVNVRERDKALHGVLARFQELNLTLHKNKCRFDMPRIEFFGIVFSGQGMSADPAKIEAIKRADAPTSVSDVCSAVYLQWRTMFLVSSATMQILLLPYVIKHVWRQHGCHVFSCSAEIFIHTCSTEVFPA